MPITPSLIELLDLHSRSELAHLHTSLPGRIEKYYPETQTADVQPMVNRVTVDPDSIEKEYDQLPVIPNVPISYPRGAGFCITWPLSIGDFVWLVFSENSTSEFRSTGQISDPIDVRRHGLGYPIAVPGCWPEFQPLSSTDLSARQDGMVIGKDGQAPQIRINDTEISLGAGATDYIALASLVLARLNAIENAYNLHVHQSSGTGVPATPLALSTTVAASITKAL